MPIDGLPVDSQELEERCGTCRTQLVMRTYLKLATKERVFAITCPKCKSEPVPVRTLAEYQNAQKMKDYVPKKQEFIGRRG